MGMVRGYMLTCDRCGAKKFYQKNQSPYEDFKNNKYSALKDGWACREVSEFSGESKQAYLCGECDKALGSFLRDFMGGRMTLD